MPGTDIQLGDLARAIGADWQRLARALGIPDGDVRQTKQEYPGNEAITTIRIWLERSGHGADCELKL